jgi:hypothetical protein
MAIESAILRDDNWFQYERKTLRILVTESDGLTAVDLSTVPPGKLEWRLLRQRGSPTTYMTKNNGVSGGITFEGDDNEIALVAIESDSPNSDYAGVPAGKHYHELWDRENDVLLTFGLAVLRPSSA